MKPIFIAGPCSIESAELLDEVASKIAQIKSNLDVDIIFKASFDKANRTSINSFRSVGLERGLQMLSDVKERWGLRLSTDIHEAWQAEPAGEIIDVIQIPAFLCRQTDLVIAADFRNIPVMQRFAPRVIMDCTHAVQRPGAGNGMSAGDSEYVPAMALAAKAFGANGYFFETHPEPEKALSDGPNMIRLDELEALIAKLK